MYEVVWRKIQSVCDKDGCLLNGREEDFNAEIIVMALGGNTVRFSAILSPVTVVLGLDPPNYTTVS